MQSEYQCPKDTVLFWPKSVIQAGLSVQRVVNGKVVPIDDYLQKCDAGLWEVFSPDSPDIKVTIDVYRMEREPLEQWQLEMHWCSNTGKPDLLASKKIALKIQSALFQLGAISTYAPIHE